MEKKGVRTQINKIRNEKVEVKTDTKDTQRIVRKYYEQHMQQIGQPGQTG